MTKEKCMQISGARAAAGISDNIQKKTSFRQQSVHSKRQYVEVSKENNRIYQLRTIYIKSRWKHGETIVNEKTSVMNDKHRKSIGRDHACCRKLVFLRKNILSLAAGIIRQYAKGKRMQKDGISLKKRKSLIKATRLLPEVSLLVKNILFLAAG